jgi:hypothetical protein
VFLFGLKKKSIVRDDVSITILLSNLLSSNSMLY